MSPSVSRDAAEQSSSSSSSSSRNIGNNEDSSVDNAAVLSDVEEDTETTSSLERAGEGRSSSSGCFKKRKLNEDDFGHQGNNGEQKQAAFVLSTEDSQEDDRTDYDTRWMTMLEELREYKAIFGNCMVPVDVKRHLKKGNGSTQLGPLFLKLGRWVTWQRQQYRLLQDGKPNSMTEERVALLNELDFCWFDDPNKRWHEMYQLLVDYKRYHGDCLIPSTYTVNKRLGEWVMRQRTMYHNYQQGKKKSWITPERIALLNKVGFQWTLQDEKWEIRLKELKDYQSENGHCLVPQCYQVKPKLGRWVHALHIEYKQLLKDKVKSTGQLTPKRISQLDALGFPWSIHGVRGPGNCARWKDQVAAMKEDLILDRKKKENSPHLMKWIQRQKIQYEKFRKGQPCTMTQQRINDLRSFGFDWFPREHEDKERGTSDQNINSSSGTTTMVAAAAAAKTRDPDDQHSSVEARTHVADRPSSSQMAESTTTMTVYKPKSASPL